MWAIRFDGNQPRVEEIDAPRPRAGEALLRTRLAGVCTTDLEIAKGYMGFRGTMGHEVVAEVIEHPDAAWVGRRVAGEINLGCGECGRCRAGLARHCARRTVLGILGKDGCFAEYLTLPVENLHAIPDAVSDELAVFVEPLAAAFEILEQIRVDPSWRVAVLGDGKLGSLVAQTMLLTGADVTLVGRHAHKLAIAAERGARTCLAQDDPGGDFDLVVEATGSAAGFERAQSILRPRGTLILKSTFHGRTELAMAPLVIDEITVVGSRCGPFAPAVRALAQARVDPRPLIEASYPLARGLPALQHASRRGAAKILLTPA